MILLYLEMRYFAMRIAGSFDCIFPNYLCFDREEFDIDSIHGVPVQRKWTPR
jgi:hypothetical protein